MTGFKSVLEVVYARHLQDNVMLEPGTHIRHGRLDMHNHNIYNCGIIWYDSSAYDATYKHNDGAMTIQCEDVIKFIRNSSRNQQREAFRCDFPSNEIKFNMDMNGQGYTLYNTNWVANYSLSNTSPGTSVGADTTSVETMLLQEDFATYNDKSHSVDVDMNEAIKAVYARNKDLEKENERLKSENKNLSLELETTKSALDVILIKI